ncbi:MAG: cytochrome b N-terminal domain-containing protein [Anaerolineae bacterium]|nr:cytochrome b N-terminal domain-containing protein [Anaerolineae bacterium]
MRHTMCLGGITILLFLIDGVTGALLMFYYVPSPAEAYQSTVAISTTVPYGNLIRNMHRLAAEGMVITVILHMARVIITGSYKPPRELNWIVGVLLLLSTLAFSFTGYLLPWDQLSYWAITIGTGMADVVPLIGSNILLLLRGGPEVGAAALIRFYALHVFVLPILVLIGISFHIYKVRKQGISRPL